MTTTTNRTYLKYAHKCTEVHTDAYRDAQRYTQVHVSCTDQCDGTAEGDRNEFANTMCSSMRLVPNVAALFQARCDTGSALDLIANAQHTLGDAASSYTALYAHQMQFTPCYDAGNDTIKNTSIDPST
jgi:hypothetical protein